MLARKARLRRAIRVHRHINPQRGDTDPQRRLRASADRPVHTHDEEKQEKRKVDNSFAVLFVVKSAKSWQESEEERQQRARGKPGRRSRPSFRKVLRTHATGNPGCRRRCRNPHHVREAIWSITRHTPPPPA